MERGKFIVFEGCEGSGKTTVMRHIYSILLGQGHDVICTREPGGTPYCETLRDIILFPKEPVDKYTQLLLFTAARRQHIVTTILPALNKGTIVLCDRYIHSSMAYQGQTFGLKEVQYINDRYGCELRPDLVIYLDIEPLRGLERNARSTKPKNRFDQMDLMFHQKARNIYLGFTQDPNYYSIDASQTLKYVVNDVANVINKHYD